MSGNAISARSALAAAKNRHLGSSSAGTTPNPSGTLKGTTPDEEFVSDNDSSSDESSSSAEEPVVNFRLCDWLYSDEKIVSSSEKETTLKLDQNETITHVGSYEFHVIQGRVLVEGVNALPSDGSSRYRVYAPTTRYITKIKGVAKSNTVRFFHIRDDRIRQLASLSPLYRRIWNAESETKPNQSFSKIVEARNDPYSRNLLPEIWNPEYQSQVDDTAINSKCAMLCGAKHAGKSAIARRLVNTYLTGPSTSTQAKQGSRSVLYLDLDPNLPEYTPHGQVSLVLVKEVNLGPTYTHPAPIPSNRTDTNELVRAHLFPIKDYGQYSTYYRSCALDLFQTALTLQQGDGRSPPIPIVINTPSSTYLRGFDSLIELVSLLRPSRLLYIEGGKETDGITNFLDEESKLKLQAACMREYGPRTILKCLPKLVEVHHPSHLDAHQRAMHMLSYFHCTGLATDKVLHRTYNPKPLSFMRPWKLRYDSSEGGEEGCIGFLTLGDSVEADSVGEVLNTSIVQIVETNDPAILDMYGKLPRGENSRLPYFPRDSNNTAKLPNPTTSKLLFTALVRSYRPEERMLLLLVPDSHFNLVAQLDPRKTVVVFGCCDHPDWALTEDPNWDYAQRVKEMEQLNPSRNGNEGTQRANKRVRFGKGDGDVEMKDSNGETEAIVHSAPAVDARAITETIDIPPWVTTQDKLAPYRHLNVLRRSRKFHQ